jgi:hypothetical protein
MRERLADGIITVRNENAQCSVAAIFCLSLSPPLMIEFYTEAISSRASIGFLVLRSPRRDFRVRLEYSKVDTEWQRSPKFRKTFYILWDVAPCVFIMNRRFGGTCHFHLQGRMNTVSEEKCKTVTNRLQFRGTDRYRGISSTLKMEATSSSEM